MLEVCKPILASAPPCIRANIKHTQENLENVRLFFHKCYRYLSILSFNDRDYLILILIRDEKIAHSSDNFLINFGLKKTAIWSKSLWVLKSQHYGLLFALLMEQSLLASIVLAIK